MLASDSRMNRRHFLGLAAAGVLSARFVRAADAQGATPPRAAQTPKEALDRLIAGNARYVAGQTTPRDFTLDRQKLVGGQAPFATVLACADSRVVPEFAFDLGRGELFVVRVAGNFVDDDGLASLEYAVAALGVPLVVVLGHSSCGAVKAAIADAGGAERLPGKLPELIASLAPAVRAAREQPGDLLANAIRENVRLQVERLQTADPVLSPRVAEKQITVTGGVYDLASGRVELIARS